MPRKKELQEHLDYLKKHADGMDDVVTLLNSRIDALESLNNVLIEDRDGWRRSYELAKLTPEAKVDTESAFRRGTDYATNRFRAWLINATSTIDEIVMDSDEK